MKRTFIFLLAVMILPLISQAQLSKVMSKYHEKQGFTVTQLDKSLYALYQRDNLPPEAQNMLQNLDEVNILNLNLDDTEVQTAEKAMNQFRETLNNPEKYKLIKSRNDDFGKQLIYAHTKNGKVTDLVVWNQNPKYLDLIELRGDIQLDKVALLSRVLNLSGLNSLTALSSNPDPYQTFRQENRFRDNFPEDLKKIQEIMRFQADPGAIIDRFFGNANDTTQSKDDDFFNPFRKMPAHPFEGLDPDFMEDILKNGGNSHKVEKFFQSFGDGNNVSSNSVQITEENGKTKIKIDSKNADMTYIIDGKKAAKDNVQMPEKILNVNIIPSREDLKKSYLFIASQDKLGSFNSYKSGILTFKYENQEYTYNLEKAQHPLLVIDGRLANSFNIDPAEILQIRPISQIEKEVGYYPNAEVIINTK